MFNVQAEVCSLIFVVATAASVDTRGNYRLIVVFYDLQRQAPFSCMRTRGSIRGCA